MSALVTVVPGVFAGVNVGDLPVVPVVDPIESAGSLYLLEPAHPVAEMVGVPGDGNRTLNLLARQGAALTDERQNDLHFTVEDSGTLNGAKGLVERTAKGGLHVVTLPAANAAGDRYGVKVADPVAEYLAEYREHHFYVSAWTRTTLLHTADSANNAMVSSVRAAGQWGIAFTEAGPVPSATSPVGERDYAGAGALGDRFMSARISPAAAFALPTPEQYAFAGGNYPLSTSTGNRGKGGARVLYRAYMEDLTVSGRTWAEVRAIDRAMWEAALLPGGRYHGDTFTDPSSL